jgi:hypothetical protein
VLRRFEHVQPALGEIRAPGERRCRRCLITTTPIEIAAKTPIAIRIGTRGEEESPDCCELTGRPLERDSTPVPAAAVEPLPSLPWPVPPPLPVLGLAFDDEPAFEDPDPEALPLPEPAGAEAPPVAEELAGGPPEPFAGLVCPVGVGTSVSY